MSFSTPVLFLIFNRPECTFQTFDRIRELKPSKLYIAADGPRTHKDGEEEKCLEARKIIQKVDWPCELKTLLRKENYGCKKAVSGAIDWLFENENEGIILEDDCVPDLSFFHFSSSMLSRYKEDERISMICGSNFLYGDSDYKKYTFDHSYFFSNYYPIWGWATWKRAWKRYNVDLNEWPELDKQGKLYWLFPIKRIANHYKGMFDILYYKGFNTWDIQWWFTCIFQHGLSIVPRHNLVRNIGEDGTHTSTQGTDFLKMPVIPIDCTDLKHPTLVYPDAYFNKELYRIIGVLKSPWQLLVFKMKLWFGFIKTH